MRLGVASDPAGPVVRLGVPIAAASQLFPRMHRLLFRANLCNSCQTLAACKPQSCPPSVPSVLSVASMLAFRKPVNSWTPAKGTTRVRQSCHLAPHRLSFEHAYCHGLRCHQPAALRPKLRLQQPEPAHQPLVGRSAWRLPTNSTMAAWDIV